MGGNLTALKQGQVAYKRTNSVISIIPVKYAISIEALIYTDLSLYFSAGLTPYRQIITIQRQTLNKASWWFTCYF